MRPPPSNTAPNTCTRGTKHLSIIDYPGAPQSRVLALLDDGGIAFLRKAGIVRSGGIVRLSVLDLAFVPEGSTPADALRNSLDLAQHAERSGYHRFWLAEHHNMPGIASAA